MPRLIESHVDTGSAQFTDNAARMRALVDDLNETVARISEGGGVARVQRHRDRGKMTARERIDALIDPGTAFLELSQL
ncbi:MAG: methylcrotonoyl-CoA carboxylase, partial [Pseudomonadota bacterium]